MEIFHRRSEGTFGFQWKQKGRRPASTYRAARLNAMRSNIAAQLKAKRLSIGASRRKYDALRKTLDL